MEGGERHTVSYQTGTLTGTDKQERDVEGERDTHSHTRSEQRQGQIDRRDMWRWRETHSVIPDRNRDRDR